MYTAAKDQASSIMYRVNIIIDSYFSGLISFFSSPFRSYSSFLTFSTGLPSSSNPLPLSSFFSTRVKVLSVRRLNRPL